MSERSERTVRDIFLAALNQPAGAEREACLAQACGADEDLRARVEALIRWHAEAGEFLEEPVTGASQLELGAPFGPTEIPGERIGPYKLLQRIGEGGCGVVYMAEQEAPIRRRVALKVIKLGMDTRKVIARFEAERQALALMDHPNIARVLDAGTTETGRPYFVMELVRGIKITRYCDENNLSTEDRLQLFTRICHAIQHAHQKGIIHRDIKPSNILVTLLDGEPVPKIIDFGIAKATGGQVLTDKTLFTAFEQFIGTPAYMSPEQAVLSALDVDTRSDIYSLGVLLYELLTGKTPFEQTDLVSAGLDEMRRIIREKQPARPSTRLGTLTEEEQTTVASRRHLQPPQLIHLLSGDLDWIVMKALEKERHRRYETAESLAGDVQRYLNDEPVTARPPSRLYAFERMLRRNKLAFAAAGAVLIALVMGLVASMWLLHKEREASRRAHAAEEAQSRLRQRAEAEGSKSQEVARFLKEMLGSVGPSVALGRDTTILKEILDNTARHVTRDLTNQPEVQAELQNVIGDVYCALENGTNAEAMHRSALAIRKGLWGNQSTNVAESLDGLAHALFVQSRLDDAEPLLQEALMIRTNLLGFEHPDVARSLWLLGNKRHVEGRHPESEDLFRKSLALRRKLLGREHPRVASALSSLAVVLSLRGKLAEADEMALEALAIRAKNPGAISVLDEEGTSIRLGVALRIRQRLGEAEEVLQQTLDAQRKLFGMDNAVLFPSTVQLSFVQLARNNLAAAEELANAANALAGNTNLVCLDVLGEVYSRREQWARAEAAFRQALPMWEKEPAVTVDEAWTRNGLAEALRRQGKLAEVEALYRDGAAAQRKLQTPLARVRESRILLGLGYFFRQQQRTNEAETAFRQALEAGRKSGTTEDSAQASGVLGELLCNQGRHAEAEAVLQEALELCAKRPPRDFSTADWIADNLSKSLLNLGRTNEVEKVLRQICELGRTFGPSGGLSGALGHLADFYRHHGRMAESEPVYREGLEICRKLGPEYAENRQWLASGLAVALRSRGALAEAELFYREAVTNAARTWPSEFPRWKWQYDDLVQLLLDQGKAPDWDSAELELARSSPDPRSRVICMLGRADEAGRQGKWEEAAGRLRATIELEPTDPYTWQKLASHLAFAGETNAYEQLRRDVLLRFSSSTNIADFSKLAKTCLFLPATSGALPVICKWAQQAVSWPGQPASIQPWAEATRALAEYRSAQFAEAMEWGRKVLGHEERIPERDLQMQCILAMSAWQLNREEQAREAFAKAREIASTKLPPLKSHDVGDRWWDYLLAHILLREAQGVFRDTSRASAAQ